MTFLSFGPDLKPNLPPSYMKELNQIHDTIKFTHELSKSELTFLDRRNPSIQR